MNLSSLYSWALRRSLTEIAEADLRQARFDLMECEKALENNIAVRDMLEGRIARLEQAVRPAASDRPVELSFRAVGGTSA